MTDLLERDDAESALHQALALARDGRGGVVLVTGEAGMGKTSLVRAFLERAAGRPAVLVGACDPIDAPRPLGPLIDVAFDVDPALARRLAAGMPRSEAFASALELVDRDDTTTVFVLEDMHWADEATLDLFTFLGRRLERRRVLVVATFRSDEVGVRHPLRTRLADVHPFVHDRIDLAALSPDSIGRLAAQSGIDDLDLDAIHTATGGNPFYVTEIIASGDPGGPLAVPPSVRDAVLARASRLTDAARVVLDASSIVPGAVELSLLETIVGDAADTHDGVDTCIAFGLLRHRSDRTVEFRHELARVAIADSIAPGRRRRLHERALEALGRAGAVDHARVAYHAAEADAGDVVLEHAPIAAAEAVRLDSYRNAAAFLESALRYDHLLDDATLGRLTREYATALAMLSRSDEELAALHRSIDAFERAGQPEEMAISLAQCASPMWGLARQQEVEGYLRRAEALLGDDPAPSYAAAFVASRRTHEYMLARLPHEAERAAQRALRLAEEIGDEPMVVSISISSGISLSMGGDDAGLERIRRGMEIARRMELDSFVSLGYGQIGSGYGELRRYDVALPALREGVEYMDAREYVHDSLYAQAWLARCEMETGDWEAAGHRAARLERHAGCTGNIRLVVMCTLGWLRSRRGDPGARAAIDEALELGRRAHHIQRLWPAAACAAEHAWLRGRLGDEIAVVHEALALANEVGYQPAIEELHHWLSIHDGTPRGEAASARTPFGLSAAGHWELALDAWLDKGCPYEAAFCRFMLGDADQVRVAYESFDGLDAAPMRDRTADRLREIGAPVPRGANTSTLDNPHGLTDRELDVLALLPLGITNREIGERLYISPKTAGHHVSHILSKLGVGTRAEAAVIAERLGLGPD